MAAENVEIIRSVVERFNAGDRTVPADLLDPDFELETPFSSVSGAPYRGHSGMGEWLRELDEQFSVWRNRLDEIREVGDIVIVIGSLHVRGRVSALSTINRPRGSDTSEPIIGSREHAFTWAQPKPSKPWASRGRRGRRTSTSCARSTRPGHAVK